MSPSQLREEIAKFVEQAWNAGLARDSNVTIVQALGAHMSSVSWSGAVAAGIGSRGGPSLDEYIGLVQNRQYTLLLSDYSFLQISFIFDRSDIVKHRLVYYPCPLNIDEEDGEIAILDLIELLQDRELIARLRQETPLRFEFDPSAANEDHAASHLHLFRDSCRIPVFAPMSLGRFIRFIFRHFYPNEWETHAFLREWMCPVMAPSISEQQRRDLHIACVP